MPTDRQIGGRDASAPGLAPVAGRRVAAIDITGHKVTKDWVIAREIRTKVGDPLDIDEVERDVARLDNLSIFAEIRVDGEPVGDDAVRLVPDPELAVFADLGLAWTDSHDFTTRRTRGGLGGGLRLLVPGSEMVRLDVGWSPESGFRFHFANGSKPKAQRARLR